MDTIIIHWARCSALNNLLLGLLGQQASIDKLTQCYKAKGILGHGTPYFGLILLGL